MLRTLFLQGPSFDGFDGGAGARYQAKREIRSFWYPTWLAQPAALVPGSKLIDAPAHDLSWDDIAHEADSHDLVILHTSTPSFSQDVRTAELLNVVLRSICTCLAWSPVFQSRYLCRLRFVLWPVNL